METLIQEVIDKIGRGNLVVGIAGPGAGKTTIFKEIIQCNEYKDKKILILSFINKLITDLENDFKDFHNIEVKTLHAFAKKHLGSIRLFENFEDVVSEDYLYIEDKSFDYSKHLLMNQLSDITNPDEFIFYKERKKFYEQKQKDKIYSFDSSILVINSYFEKYTEKVPQYDLILIDEFQDFNELEYNLIKILNTKSKIIIVGDDDQSLYEFKLARPSIIRSLYKDVNKESFSLDYCWRCTEVIVNSVNNLIKESKDRGFLVDRVEKRFLYPKNQNLEKDSLSEKINKIDFFPKLKGDKLIYELSKKIKHDTEGNNSKRVLIISPKYYHQTIYDGLLKKGFNIVDYELFSNESHAHKSHKILIDVFDTISSRKTDDLNLRLILDLYLNKDEIKALLCTNKRIWNCLTKETKEKIEYDIELFKKCKKGVQSLSAEEIVRLNQIFNLKNLISRMLNGFGKVNSKSIEVEIVTTMSSKGLSADLVYYLYVDDKELFGDNIEITDGKICEFLVGVTRAKERLTLISKNDEDPTVLGFLGKNNINIVETN